MACCFSSSENNKVIMVELVELKPELVSSFCLVLSVTCNIGKVKKYCSRDSRVRNVIYAFTYHLFIS